MPTDRGSAGLSKTSFKTPKSSKTIYANLNTAGWHQVWTKDRHFLRRRNLPQRIIFGKTRNSWMQAQNFFILWRPSNLMATTDIWSEDLRLLPKHTSYQLLKARLNWCTQLPIQASETIRGSGLPPTVEKELLMLSKRILYLRQVQQPCIKETRMKKLWTYVQETKRRILTANSDSSQSLK
jgi:hypothetical protein